MTKTKRSYVSEAVLGVIPKVHNTGIRINRGLPRPAGACPPPTGLDARAGVAEALPAVSRVRDGARGAPMPRSRLGPQLPRPWKFTAALVICAEGRVRRKTSAIRRAADDPSLIPGSFSRGGPTQAADTIEHLGAPWYARRNLWSCGALAHTLRGQLHFFVLRRPGPLVYAPACAHARVAAGDSVCIRVLLTNSSLAVERARRVTARQVTPLPPLGIWR